MLPSLRLLMPLVKAVCAAMLCITALLYAQSRVSPSQDAHAKSLYAEGMSAAQKGNLAEAQVAFEKLVGIAPGSPEAHNSLGWVFLIQNEVDAAVAEFRSAIRLKPEFPQAHMNLANALAQRRDFAQAETHARESIRMAPKDSETHRTLGRVLSF